MKKIILSLCLALLLTSCFGLSSESSKTGLKELEKTGFNISVPDSWQELGAGEFPKPKVGEVVLALASKTQRQGYINNLLILKMDSTLGESSQGLIANTKAGLKASLEKFKLLSEKNIDFSDETKGTILTYIGKYSKNTPELTYIQTAKSCGESNYFLTISLAEQLESYEKYEYLLESFDCE